MYSRNSQSKICLKFKSKPKIFFLGIVKLGIDVSALSGLAEHLKGDGEVTCIGSECSSDTGA